jgi:hypothetical protein
MRQWLLLVVGASLLGWFAAPLPGAVPEAVQARRDDWRPTALPVLRQQTQAAVDVATAGYWGAPAVADTAASTPAAPEDPRWRLAGLFGSGKERHVIVTFNAASKPPSYLKTGDKLPSGHRIVNIDDNEVCIQVGKRVLRLAVERLDS